MNNLLNFLKVGLILHIATSVWFGIFFAVIHDHLWEGLIKGFFLGPLIFGNALYVGSLVFSTTAIYFLYKRS